MNLLGNQEAMNLEYDFFDKMSEFRLYPGGGLWINQGSMTVAFGVTFMVSTIVALTDAVDGFVNREPVINWVRFIDVKSNQVISDHQNYFRAVQGSRVDTSEAYFQQPGMLIDGYHYAKPYELTEQQQVQRTTRIQVEDGYIDVYITPNTSEQIITKTVHFVDKYGLSVAPDYVTNTVVKPNVAVNHVGTAGKLTTNVKLDISGYEIVQIQKGTLDTQWVSYGDPDLDFRVVYKKSTESKPEVPIKKQVADSKNEPEKGGNASYTFYI